ncbi:MAG: AAA family ATPase [Bacteroidota bacterium]|nr:AAA family ATPase [Bacteroidota bacterium]
MKEKLIIKNFGPITDIELELGRFNVLIGENATGKSVVAKLLAVCRYFSFILNDDLFPNAFEEGLNSRGLSEFIQKDSYVFYECEHYSFEVERGLKKETDIDQEKGTLNYEYEVPVFYPTLKAKTNKFEKLLNELEAIKPKQLENAYLNLSVLNWTIPASFFQNDVAVVLDNPFYVPTERGLQSIFSLGKNSIRNLSDALFNQLAELNQIAVSFKNETIIEPLGIIYKNEKGEGYIRKDADSKYFSLFNAASGYQSTIPVVLLVDYYTEIRKKKKTFIVEEPELNLFPTAQNKLIKFLVNKTINYGNSIFLTTHSPYILTSLNNLMYAYQVGQNHEAESNEIIGKEYWVDPNEVSAYMLLPDGTCEDILDREENMIKAEKIDGVSNFLNEQFDALLNIELVPK